MRSNMMRLAYSFETKYRVIMLNTEKRTEGPVSLPVVKGLVWYTDGSKMQKRTGTRVCG
jgi:hypothetical protein